MAEDAIAKLNQLQRLYERYFTDLATDACRDIAQAWAAAISVEAPVDTGRLARTVKGTGGAITIQYYWKYAAYGHRIYSKKLGGHMIKRLDAKGEPVYAYSKPNDFMERAWHSSAVTFILRKYAKLGVHVPYPLGAVNMAIHEQ